MVGKKLAMVLPSAGFGKGCKSGIYVMLIFLTRYFRKSIEPFSNILKLGAVMSFKFKIISSFKN